MFPDARDQAVSEDAAPELAESLLTPFLLFQAGSLLKQDWTHECHLRVAAAFYLVLGEMGCSAMSKGIRRLNEAHGVANTATGGYHETLTVVWFQLVSRAADRSGLARNPKNEKLVCETLRALADRQLPLRHYSRERLLSQEARLGWLEPDLSPLKAR